MNAKSNYRGIPGCCPLLLLAACGATTQVPEPVVRVVEVRVPVDDPACAREAIARLGPRPDYPDSAAALNSVPNTFRGVALLKAGREMRIAREVAYEGALAICAGARP